MSRPLCVRLMGCQALTGSWLVRPISKSLDTFAAAKRYSAAFSGSPHPELFFPRKTTGILTSANSPRDRSPSLQRIGAGLPPEPASTGAPRFDDRLRGRGLPIPAGPRRRSDYVPTQDLCNSASACLFNSACRRGSRSASAHSQRDGEWRRNTDHHQRLELRFQPSRGLARHYAVDRYQFHQLQHHREFALGTEPRSLPAPS